MIDMKEKLRDALKHKPSEVTFDEAGAPPPGADQYSVQYLKMAAAANIQEWAETDDLDGGETYANRLMGQMVGIADQNKDGEITEDEQDVLDVALNAAWDYLSSLGVSDEDCSSLLNDWDDDTADRVRDLVASALPDGEDAAGEHMDDFTFGSEDQEPALDAVYKKVLAVRHGKKVRINRRMSGTVRLSAKQKVAIRKALMRSHSATAMMRRMRSMRVRRQ